MAKPICRYVCLCAKAINEVKTFSNNRIDHLGCRFYIISIIAIYHYIDVSINIGKHATYDKSFALSGLIPYYSTSGFCFSTCFVCRIVVVNVDFSIRKMAAKTNMKMLLV